MNTLDKSTLLPCLEIGRIGTSAKDVIDQASSFIFKDGYLCTYNDEISVRCKLPDEFAELEGAVKADPFYNFINKLPKPEADFEFTEKELLIKCGRTKAGFLFENDVRLPFDELPVIKKWKALPPEALQWVTMAASFSSTDMSKPVLTCIHFSENRVEASDGFQIFQAILPTAIPFSILLPANTARTIVKFAPTHIGQSEDTGWVQFKKDDVIISCRVFEDKFPKISPFFDLPDAHEFTLPKSLVGMMGRLSIFSKKDREMDESISIVVQEGKVLLKSQGECGWAQESGKTDYSGPTLSFCITPYLLKEAVVSGRKCAVSNSSILFVEENWKYLAKLRSNVE